MILNVNETIRCLFSRCHTTSLPIPPPDTINHEQIKTLYFLKTLNLKYK